VLVIGGDLSSLAGPLDYGRAAARVGGEPTRPANAGGGFLSARAPRAQGGSGDVLAGYIGGLIAQPDLQQDPGKTIRYAVWQHGAAADRLQERRKGWVVEELVEELAR